MAWEVTQTEVNMTWDAEQEEQKVNEMEITYIDPVTGGPRSRMVYIDPEDWQQRYQTRLLVSSDLVNTISEAVSTWLARWQQIHQRLEDSRMGYFCDLLRLREKIQKLLEQIERGEPEADRDRRGSTTVRSSVSEEVPLPLDTLNEEKELDEPDGEVGEAEEPENPEEEPKEPNEVCPVHFFHPDSYLDCWTHEMLQRALKSMRARLQAEIDSFIEKINVMGAGTWRQLLMYFLAKGQDPGALAKGLIEAAEDANEKRAIINTMTNGLQDTYDALLAQFEILQEEETDMNNRKQEITDLELWQRKRIEELLDAIERYKAELAAPLFEEPPEEDDTEALAAAQVQMFDEKEASLKAVMAEIRRLRALLEEWKTRLETECDMEALQKLQDEVNEWKRRRRMWELRTEKYNEQADASEERIQKLQDRIAKEKELSVGLKEKLASCPNINPGALKMKRLQREMRELDAEAKRIKAAMVDPLMRIKAMRSQLRDLYEKLGWEWDLSDSEDEDDEDKPYWLRRKIAVNGFLPFNQHEFVYSEKDYHKKRLKRARQTRELDLSNLIGTQMKAKRQEFGESSKPIVNSRELVIEDEEEAGPTLFGKGEPATDPVDPVQRAISSYTDRLTGLPGKREALAETPCWRHAKESEQQESRQFELGRLLQLRESFEVQIQQCVECFVDLLPPSGNLGDLRARLSGTLSKLRRLPEDPMAWQAQELELEIQETCATLQSMIEEAIAVGDQVHPISAAMMHSVRFSDLRVLLSEVLLIERKLRETIRTRRTSQRHGSSQRYGDSALFDESPILTPTGGSFFPSTSSSPRLRGQTAPGGIFDDCSEGDFSGFTLAANSRSLSSADELSGSLKLPPRLILGQTAPLLGGRKGMKKESRKKVDFGFRPDGGGEDSVENWSLFKVSKASTATSGFGDSVSTGMGLTTSSGFIGDKVRRTDTKIRRHKAEVDCDFHEYMSQTRQMDESWRSGSAPSPIHAKGKKKVCPPLPKLVHSASAGRNLVAANVNVARGDVLNMWGKSPPRVSLRVSVSAGRL